MFWRAVKAEFHNQRFVLLWGFAIAVLVYAFLHSSPWRNPDINFDYFRLVGTLIFLASASFSGSFAFGRHSRESGIAIFKFLLKLAIGAISTIACGMLIVISLALSVSMNSGDTFLDSIYPDFARFPGSTVYFYGSSIAFACSALFSLLIKRLWMSVLTGFVFGSSILFLTASFWVRQPFETYLTRRPANTALLVTGMLVLLSSWIIASPAKRLNLSVWLVLGLSAATIMAAFGSSALVFLSLPLSRTNNLYLPEVSTKGAYIVSGAYDDMGQQIWMIPIEPERSNRVAKEHAYAADISPDGNWFSYFSQKGIFGLRSFSVDLRIAKIDGTQDTILLAGFARRMSDEDERGARGKEFSPDSKRIALLCDTTIYVVDLKGRIICQSIIPSNAYVDLLGWRPDGEEILILHRKQRCIQAYNVAERRFRTVYQFNQRLRFFRPEHAGPVRYVLDGNVLVDLDNGIAQILPGYRNEAPAVVSPDQNTLIYYDWGDPSNLKGSYSYVRCICLNTGRDELCAQFRGVIRQPIFSPDGSRIGIEHQTESRQIQAVVLDGDSIVRRFEGWGLIAWMDSKRIVLADDPISPKRMALGDIDTGQIQQFYP